MRGLILLFAACCVASCVLAEHEFEQIGKDIALFSTDLINFQHEMESNIEKATHKRQEVIDMKARILYLEGTGCEDRFEFQCGGLVPKCISRLLVCDGKADCPNAAEESQCHILTPVDSKWKATFTWDFCTTRKPHEMEMHIISYDIPNILRSFPEVRADMSMHAQMDDFRYATTFRLHGVMDMLPAAHVLYFDPPESDGLALKCTFDGIHDDHCHGEIIYQSSQHKCAEFFMERIH